MDIEKPQTHFNKTELSSLYKISKATITNILRNKPADERLPDLRGRITDTWTRESFENHLAEYEKVKRDNLSHMAGDDILSDLRKVNLQLKNDHQELKNAQLRGELFSRELIYKYMVEWKAYLFANLKQLLMVRLPIEWAGKSAEEIRPIAEQVVNEVSGEFTKSTEAIISKLKKPEVNSTEDDEAEPTV